MNDTALNIIVSAIAVTFIIDASIASDDALLHARDANSASCR